MSTPNTAAFEAANAHFASTFDQGHLPMPPAKKVAVLACMDARLHPEKVLGINVGDSHVIRNAGGRASADALRSLAISQRLLGTEELVIVHHTDCGMLTFSNHDIKAKIKADLGEAAAAEAASIDFLPFPDLEQSVRDDVAIVRASKIVDPNIPITGYVYDVKTGKVSKVN